MCSARSRSPLFEEVARFSRLAKLLVAEVGDPDASRAGARVKRILSYHAQQANTGSET
jgi:hypothetical protein